MYRSVSLMCCYRCVFFAALYRNHVLRHVSLCISMHVHRVGHNIAIALCLKDRFRYYFVCLCVCVSPLPCVSCIAIAVAVCVAMGVIMLLSGCVGAAPAMHRDRAARQWHIAMARTIMSTDAEPDGDEV